MTRIEATFARDSETHVMKPAAIIHAAALAALFTAHFAYAQELAGVRRALQTMVAAETQAAPPAPPALDFV